MDGERPRGFVSVDPSIREYDHTDLVVCKEFVGAHVVSWEEETVGSGATLSPILLEPRW